MKQPQKSAKTFTNFLDFNSQLSCNLHPYSSSSYVGICPHCLNDRLVKLVCSDCGERRVSSCSCCFELSSAPYRNSCSYLDIGRISFLIENDKVDHKRRSFLRSSSSNRVEANKSNGFWRIKRLFSKRRNKGRGGNLEFLDENSEMGSFRHADEFADNLDEVEGVCSVVRMKETDLSGIDEKGFIELKLDSSYECKQDLFGGRASDDGCRNEKIAAGLRRNGDGGGSCRVTMNERRLEEGSRNYKVWKWSLKFR